MASKIFSKLNSFPPRLCRLVARKGLRTESKPMTVDDLVERTGFCRDFVIRIGGMMNWDSLKLSEIKKFSEACGVDFSRLNSQRRFIKRYFLRGKNHHYLKNSSPAQRKMIAGILKSLKQR